MTATRYDTSRSSKTSWRLTRGWKLTKEPYRPLPYLLQDVRVRWEVNDYNQIVQSLPSSAWCISLPGSREGTRVKNIALKRFLAKLGPSAQLGSTLAMYRESVEMVVDRATVLRKAFRDLKKGRFRSFLNRISAGPKPAHRNWHRNKPADAGGLWLEYWMGWAPLAGDIFTSYDVLTKPFPWMKIKGAAGSDIAMPPYGFEGPTRPYWTRETAHGKGVCLVQAEVQVSNPNLYLSDRLGLLNPFYILYDLMPWSWMLNWFVNIEQMAIGMVSPQGITFRNSFHTTFWKITSQYDQAYPLYNQRSKGVNAACIVERLLGLPSAKFSFDFSGLSITKAATAISLLLQQLRKP